MRQYREVVLATDCIQTKRLLSNTYFDVISLEEMERRRDEFDQTITLTYELTPNLSYIDGYACSAGVNLDDKIPIVRSDWRDIVGYPYVLFAPNTSRWIEGMRNWGRSKFDDLKLRLERELDTYVIQLENDYSFEEMLSLVRHCVLFLGNDSAPSVLAQCFNRRAFIIYGATHPKYNLFSSRATPIHSELECVGCKHRARHTKIECATPLCLSNIGVDSVYRFVSESISGGG